MSTNRLARETSPYLLQHKDNPVHWWAWGPDALAEAKSTGKPILLSVGYAACHWCHVMAHESFEDEATAAVMNELFVNIKVDREERPDIDAIYMGALHKLKQQGGWPLTMFLDSQARPFWGGTYFPPAPRFGRPGFVGVLQEVERIFRQEPDRVEQNAEAISRMLADQGAEPGGMEVSDPMLLDLTARMVRAVDPAHGGINGAPKFPQWSFFWLLWRGAIRYGHELSQRAVETTLTNICQGGIYDHLAGGFARYSVDERWLAPHFEKMLYDNALLIDLMTEVWRESHNPLYKVRVAETVSWVMSEMVAEGGGFAASLDADSEGEEGKFYVWSAAEIEDVLGAEDAQFFSAIYDVSAEGNWEEKNILNRLEKPVLLSDSQEARLLSLRQKLLAARSSRIRPGWDDKVLADWNGLMIAALARASVVFEQPQWLAAAEQAFAFIETNMMSDGRLLHSYRDGRAKAPAPASDYANMVWGALRLYEATSNDTYLGAARRWSDILALHYWDNASGGYANTADDTGDVIVRLRQAHDDATPNANAIQLSNLITLNVLTGETRYLERAEGILQAFAADIGGNILGHCALLASAMDWISPQLVAITGTEQPAGRALANALNRLSLPGAITAELASASPKDLPAALRGKSAANTGPAAYVCVGPQCSAPVENAEALFTLLHDSRRAAPAA